jgi:hypothetical protein
MNAEWWTAWAVSNGTPIVITVVIVLWMRGLWRRQLDRAEAILAVQRENGELLRNAVALLQDIREISKGKP